VKTKRRRETIANGCGAATCRICTASSPLEAACGSGRRGRWTCTRPVTWSRCAPPSSATCRRDASLQRWCQRHRTIASAHARAHACMHAHGHAPHPTTISRAPPFAHGARAFARIQIAWGTTGRRDVAVDADCTPTALLAKRHARRVTRAAPDASGDMRAISPAASGDIRSVISAGGIKRTSPAACGDIALISIRPDTRTGPSEDANTGNG